jgi:Family of unknown function (DUF6263)
MKAQASSWLLVGMVACAWPSVASGQTLLRWKLKAGESLNVEVQQETESQVAFSGKSTTTKIDLTVELGWLVTAADDKGIKLKQTIKGVKLKLQSPQGGLIDYDSAAAARPAGQAREVADSIKPLIGTEIELTMSDRGEIVAAEPVNKLAEELLAAEGQPQEQKAFSRTAIQQLLRQSLVILPEKAVAANDEWKNTSNLAGAAGNYQQVTTYRLAGISDQGGQPIARLEMTAKLDPAAAATPSAKLPSGKRPTVGKLTVKSHQQSGTVLFAPEQGRVVEAEQTQKLVTERPYRETTIVVTLSSKQKTTVRPAAP